MTYYHSKYGTYKRKKKSPSKYIKWGILLFIVLAIIVGYFLYQVVYKVNVWTPEGKNISIYIPSDATYDDVKNILYEKGLIIHRKDFEWWAGKKDYPDLIKPGRYIIENGMNNSELINLLHSGNQVPVMVTFNNVRDIYQMAGKVSKQIEADSASIVNDLMSPEVLSSMGLTLQTNSIIFIPDSYELYWNTSAGAFIARMYDEYDKFWNAERLEKAEKLDMSIAEVVTLASIVQKETNKDDEKALIAGVYINRLNRGWRLQADPTLVYAIGDYNIKRVLNVHKNFDSPYNTYKNGGLPPGPICIPSKSSIDAVLENKNEGYLYFCAKDDLSGYHVFAKTNTQHNRNARKYQKALDKMRIYK